MTVIVSKFNKAFEKFKDDEVVQEAKYPTSDTREYYKIVSASNSKERLQNHSEERLQNHSEDA